jgi:hypothetical protein
MDPCSNVKDLTQTLNNTFVKYVEEGGALEIKKKKKIMFL